jgi:putative salt-induced outer membrane protein YdiY
MLERTRGWLGLAACALVLATSAGLARAQAGGQDFPIDVSAPGAMSSVTLATGDTLRCRVLQVTEDTVVLEHALLGRMFLSRDSVTAMTPLTQTDSPPLPPGPTNPADAGEPAAPSADAVDNAPDAIAPIAAAPTGAVASPLDLLTAPDEKSFWVGWTRSVDLGINGSSGNSDTFNGRIALNLARKTTRMETTAGALYLYQRDNEGVTKDRGEANFRNDWLLKDSRWRLWAQAKGEYDADADWTARVSSAAGVGYEFIQNDKTTLIGRVGLGASREFGGMSNDVVPEGVLGADFTHKINDRNSVFANVDYFPDLSEFGEFRTVSKAGWETIVDPDTKLNLKLGIEHRYDSDPGDAEASEIDYFVTMGWTF